MNEMFVFGLLIALVLCLVLLAGFINELMQDDWDEACARMIDKMDRWIDKKMGRGGDE